ncbi:MAG: hypothetical protein IPP29_18870 [Bacteroidetes bacterium]|nr:hypothetical protein [Bacteroidota bacterium]
MFCITGSIDALNAQYPKAAKVYNRENKLMISGDSLIGDAWYREYVLVPFPNDTTKYYAFSAGVTTIHGFYYSIIDMSQDSGRGAVIQKNVPLQGTNFIASDGVAAIQHGNGRDWWVVIREWSQANNDYYFYLVTKDSVYLDHIQSIGFLSEPGFGKIKPSYDGSKIATSQPSGYVSVFDFDRCTGYLSNEIVVEPPRANDTLYTWAWDCAISKNNRYIYVSQLYNYHDTLSHLFQYDLQAANVQASQDTLATLALPINIGALELAPNNKIYLSCWYNPVGTFMYPFPDSVHNYINENLSVINEPDSDNCYFTPFSFYLGGHRTYMGLPNNPNYELGRLYGSPCDTLQWTNLTPALSKGEGVMQITYISAWEKLFINASGLKGKNVTVSIYDGKGSLKFEVRGLKAVNGYFTLDVDCAGWSDGLYVVHLSAEKERLSKKFIKE